MRRHKPRIRRRGAVVLPELIPAEILGVTGKQSRMDSHDTERNSERQIVVAIPAFLERASLQNK